MKARGGPELALFDHVPASLLDVPAADLWAHLGSPSLFHIAGRRPDVLFVSVLLHGNEHTGWRAMQDIFRRYLGKPLPRSLLLFVGNVEAARAGARTLPHQHDYNRVWPGTPDTTAPEAALMRDVFEIVRKQAPFAGIDVHNNTGNNPHYACVTKLTPDFLHLARLFSRTVVYIEKPKGIQTAALSMVCPSVTIECGRSEDTAGDEHVVEFISSALGLSQWPSHPVPEADVDLMRTYAIVKVPQSVSFSFDGSDADLRFRPDIDRLNFSELDVGTSFGRLGGRQNRRVEVLPGGDFDDVVDDYFDYTGGEIRLARSAIPAMLTRDPKAVRLDSLGYLMHRIDLDGRRVG